MAVRKYTGITDGKNRIQNKKDAVESMVYILGYYFGMRKVGTIGDSLTSVHSTGRAFDIRAWDLTRKPKPDYGVDNFEEKNWNLINYLYMNRDYLGVEEIHDYVGLYVSGTLTRYPNKFIGNNSNYGAGYRCNRDNIQEAYAPTGWKRWSLEAHISHSGDSVGSKWVHVEMSPAAARNEKLLISKLDISLKKYFKNSWHSITLVGSGNDAYVQATNVKNKPHPIQ